MKDEWYGDKRDLVKWTVLLHLAKRFRSAVIVQIAYRRPSAFGDVLVDGETVPVSRAVLAHFKDLTTIRRLGAVPTIVVFDRDWTGRITYHDEAIAFLAGFPAGKRLVFLDPDTGLEPAGKPGPTHVTGSEARRVWNALAPGDGFVFYQHMDRGTPHWLERKHGELAKALDLAPADLKTAHGPDVSGDVAFYFACKRDTSANDPRTQETP